MAGSNTQKITNLVRDFVNDSTRRPAPPPLKRAQAGDGPQSEWVADWQRSPSLEALHRLLDTSRLSVPALARRAGLTHHELYVLEQVFEQPTGPSELAQRLGVTTAATTGIVDRLEARGHVQREPHPTDRRRTVVVCTPSGREELIGHMMPMFRELAAIDEAMTPEERETVRRFLEAADRAVSRLL